MNPCGRRPRAWWAVLLGLVVMAGGVRPASAAAPPYRIPVAWQRQRTVLARFDTLEARGDSPGAWTFLDSLVGAARARGDRQLWLQALIRRGGTRTFRGNLAAGDPDLRAADSLAVAMRDTLGQLLVLEWRLFGWGTRDRFDVTLPLARRMLALAVQVREPSFEGWARVGPAWADLRRGRLASSAKHYRRAIACFRRAADPIGLHQARIGLARVLAAQGRTEAQRGVYLDLLADARATHDRYSEGHALNNLGELEFALGDPAAAMERWRAADSLRRSAGIATTGEDGPAFNLALALAQLHRFDEAAAQLEALAATAHRTANTPDWLAARTQLGLVRARQERPDEAEVVLLDALAHAGEATAADRGWTWLALASVRAGRGRLPETLAALDALAREPIGAADHVLPHAAARLRCEVLVRTGQAREALVQLAAGEAYATDELNGPARVEELRALAWRALGAPDSALAAMRRAQVLRLRLRARASTFEWREAIGMDAAGSEVEYARMILAAPSVGPRAQRERRAFDALQQVTARTLLERVQAPGGTGAPAVTHAVRLATLQATVLREGELLLDVHEGAEATLVFAVTRHAFRLAQLPAGGELAARGARFRDVVLGDDAPARDAVARAMGTLYFAGCADLLRASRRVLVCAGADPLPMAMLVVDGEPLVARHEVAFVPSATLLARARSRAASPATGGLLAVAGWSDGEGHRLPGAEDEVRWLARTFGGVTLRAPDAGRRAGAIVAELGGYEIVHLAGHAENDEGNPWASAMLLGRPGAPQSWLRASAVARTHLSARLCVLSGCSSLGVGEPGEGALGLSAAFLVAGAQATLATLWPVNDASSAGFMREFYRALAAGQAAGEALRTAQNALRARAGTAAPAHWAGFVLVGEPLARVSFERAGFFAPGAGRAPAAAGTRR